MTPRHKRILLVLGILAGVGIAAALAMQAFRSNIMYYFDPTQVAAGEVKAGKRFQLGGMVEVGSVKRQTGSLEMSFVVTDFQHKLPVRYTGVLPDLFKENSGVVAHGRLDASGVFIADEIVAKHDENYMPPAMKKSLQKGESPPRAGDLNAARDRSVRHDPGAVAGGGPGLLRHCRCMEGQRALDVSRRARGCRAVRVAGAGLRLPDLGLRAQRFLREDGGRPFEHGVADLLPRGRRLGQSRRQPAVLGVRAVDVDGGGGGLVGLAAAHLLCPRAGCAGLHQHGIPAVLSGHVQSLRAAAAGVARRR